MGSWLTAPTTLHSYRPTVSASANPLTLIKPSVEQTAVIMMRLSIEVSSK
jgi:hypothetical protein